MGWNSNNARVGYGFLSPRHHLLAKHFTSSNNRRIFGNDDVVHTIQTGGGGIALEGGMLHLEADTTHTGKTWVHSGRLRVDGDIRTSERVVAGPGGVVAGSGKLPVTESRGSIEPAGILSAVSLVPVQAARFHFSLTGAAPEYQNASSSPNDVLRLTANTPLSAALTSANVVSIYLGGEPPEAGAVMRGGFFFDNPAANPSLVSGALYQVFVADVFRLRNDGRFPSCDAIRVRVGISPRKTHGNPDSHGCHPLTVSGGLSHVRAMAVAEDFRAFSEAALPVA